MSLCRFIIAVSLILLTGCIDNSKKEVLPPTPKQKHTVAQHKSEAPHFKGTKVPVLCYHAIREIGPHDSSDQKAYSVTPENFELQIKSLAEEGYHSVTPDELKNFYTNHGILPEKPIMITFDDGRKDQVTIGAATLEKYHFKGVYFVMTVSLGKKHYMSRDDVKMLADHGHIIGCHTWDHHMVTKYQGNDWILQLTKPRKQLEAITNKPVTTFAYPFGVWNNAAADSLKTHGLTTAFIFYGKQDSIRPLYTIERINIPSTMKIKNFVAQIEKTGTN